MSYKLVRKSVNQLQQLEDEVNLLIGLGWKVIGEVKQSKCDGVPIFVQQMEYNSNHPKRLPNVKHTESSTT